MLHQTQANALCIHFTITCCLKFCSQHEHRRSFCGNSVWAHLVRISQHTRSLSRSSFICHSLAVTLLLPAAASASWRSLSFLMVRADDSASSCNRSRVVFSEVASATTRLAHLGEGQLALLETVFDLEFLRRDRGKFRLQFQRRVLHRGQAPVVGDLECCSAGNGPLEHEGITICAFRFFSTSEARSSILSCFSTLRCAVLHSASIPSFARIAWKYLLSAFAF